MDLIDLLRLKLIFSKVFFSQKSIYSEIFCAIVLICFDMR